MPNEELIISKLDSLKELFEQRFEHNEKLHGVTNDHLTKLNGQTQKNTEFRIRAGVLIGFGGVVLPILVSAAITKLL